MSGILSKQFSDHQDYIPILNNINHEYHSPTYIKITKQDKESMQILQKKLYIPSSQVKSKYLFILGKDYT